MPMLDLCGVCCMCLSVWAIIQLSFMALFYHMETPILIHDVEAHNTKNFEDFIQKTRANYASNARNCMITAIIYVITLLLSIACIVYANKKAAKQAKLQEDDELVCVPVMPKPPKLLAADEPVKGEKSHKKQDKHLKQTQQRKLHPKDKRLKEKA